MANGERSNFPSATDNRNGLRVGCSRGYGTVSGNAATAVAKGECARGRRCTWPTDARLRDGIARGNVQGGLDLVQRKGKTVTCRDARPRARRARTWKPKSGAAAATEAAGKPKAIALLHSGTTVLWHRLTVFPFSFPSSWSSRGKAAFTTSFRGDARPFLYSSERLAGILLGRKN